MTYFVLKYGIDCDTNNIVTPDRDGLGGSFGGHQVTDLLNSSTYCLNKSMSESDT